MHLRSSALLAVVFFAWAGCAGPAAGTVSAAPAAVTYLAGDLPADVVARAAQQAPQVRLLAGLTAEQALAHAAEADGVDGRLVTPQFLAKAARLRWVQAMSAGVERHLAEPAIAGADGPVLTNLSGAHGPTIADHVFAMVLALGRDLRHRFAQQAAAQWDRQGSGAPPRTLQGHTLLVVGLGEIGTEVARRGQGFGMRVLATRRTDAPAPPFVERVGRSEDLLAMLPEADVVVVCLPLTKATERLFDARAFSAMRRDAVFVNIARGRIVDTGALVAALQQGRLGGACLDVTDPEPLPASSPLWAMPNVVITPHVAADGELSDERGHAILLENLRRFAAGEPLRNVVDKRAGY